MQRLLTVVICLLAIGAAAYATAPTAAELLAISSRGSGVVFGTLLLAFIAGEVVRFLKLPRVIGYAVVGLVAVPLNRSLFTAAADPAQTFASWEVLFGAALGLTGLAVGLRVDLSMLRVHGRTVATHALFHIALAGSLLAAFSWWVVPLFGVTPVSPAACVVIGLIAVASSSTAIYGVNSDLRAEGTLPDLQILIALTKDALILGTILVGLLVVGLDVELSVPTLRDLHAERWVNVGATLLVGLGVGLLLIGCLRWVSDQVVIVSFGAAVTAAVIAPDAAMWLFAGGLLAGAVATNGSPFGFRLAESLERFSPLFLSVVFVFAIVAAEIPIDGAVWLAALTAMVVRAAALYLGSRGASALSTHVGGRHLHYSLFAQFLVAIFAIRIVEDANLARFEGIEEFLMPLVLLNLLMGATLHRAALIRSGFAAEAGAEEEGDVIVDGDRPRGAIDTVLDDDRSLLPSPSYPDPTFRSTRLNRLTDRVRQRLIRSQDRVAHEFFDPRREFFRHLLDELREQLQGHVSETVQRLHDAGDPVERTEIIRERRAALDQEFGSLIVRFGPTHEPGDLGETFKDFVVDVERACNVDDHVRAPEEDVTRERRPGDDWYTRLRKAVHFLSTGFGPRPMRAVPVRTLSRHHLAHGLPALLATTVNLDGNFRVYVWQRVSHAYRDAVDLYRQTLQHLDPEVAEASPDLGATLGRVDEKAEREVKELAAFDERLRELARVRGERSEASEAGPEPLLPPRRDDGEDDVVLSAWAQLVDDMPTHLDDLERDVFDFEADVRRRLALTTDAAYQNLLEDLAKAGTYALGTHKIDSATRQSASKRHLEELVAELEHWNELALAFVDRRNMRLAFRAVEARLRPLLDTFIRKVEAELCSHLTYYPAEISQRCDDVVESLDQSIRAGVSDADLGDAFIQIRRNLSNFLQEEALQSVEEMRDADTFEELTREFTTQLTEIVEDQRAIYIVADESFLDRPEWVGAGDIEPSQVPFHDVLDKHLVQATAATLNELAMRVRNAVGVVATGLGEVNRVITFSLDAATNELHSDDEAKRQLVTEFAVGGIDRAGAHASKLLEQVQSEIDGIDRDILDRTVEHVRTVRRYMFDESTGRLERFASEVEKDRSALRRQGFEFLSDLRSSAATTLQTAARPARAVVDLARERLKLDETGREELLEDSGIATFEWERLTDLPLAYRRLFTPRPVEISELFVARDRAMDRASSAIARWQSGRRTSIVVTGELGAGKTSFIHRLLADRLSSAKMLRWNVRRRITTRQELALELGKQFGVRQTTTVERLLAALSHDDAPRVVVVDGIERLFLRTMNGDDALSAFFSVVAQSPDEFLWLVTCNSSLWNYLATMKDAEALFTDHVRAEPFGREATEQLIVQRHRMSGYGLRFRVDETESLTPKGFLGSQQDRLKTRYFNRLHETTGGHPLLALYYWLKSVEIDEDDTAVVDTLRPLRTDDLRRFADDKLIALGQFLLHEELSEEGFAAVMRTSEEKARRDLAFLESLNLIAREPGHRYDHRINEVLHRDVKRLLVERNIV